MADTWLLRWDTRNEDKPKVILPKRDESRSIAFFGQDNQSFVIFDGYLFDKNAFQTARDFADAEFIACAYTQYREDLFDELRGGFTLAIWDHFQQTLVAGRDAMGLNPFYYYWDGRHFLLSTSLDAILSQPEVDSSFNRMIIAEYIQNIWHSHQKTETFYQNIQRLPAAHQLSLKEGLLVTSRYWDPVPPGVTWANEEELDAFTQVLERAVARCLSVGADSLALSGGFDSVSIAVLAAEQLNGQRPLHAVSLRFTDFICDEGETQIAVARALGMPQTIRTFKDSLDNDDYLEASLTLSQTSPCPVLSPWQSMFTGLLRSAATHGLNNLLMGTGGDEMFVVDLTYGADCLANLDLRGLWHFYRTIQRASAFSPLHVARIVFWNGSIKPEIRMQASKTLDRTAPGLKARYLRRRLALPSWVAPSDITLREQLEHRRLNQIPVPSAPGEGAYIRSIRNLPQSPLLMLEIEQMTSWAINAGFALQFPFFDRDLVELTMRIYPQHLLAGGQAKAPLRRLVAERLSSVDLPQKKVDFAQPANELMRSSGKSAWQNLDGPQMISELGIADADSLNQLTERYFSGKDHNFLQIWLVIGTEMWLRAKSS